MRWMWVLMVGVVAGASKLVGDSLASAATGANILGLYNLAGAVAQGFGNEFPMLGRTRELAALAYRAYELLALGNWEIYMSIYPTTLAYTQGGIEGVRELIPNPQDTLRQAWERLDAARANQNDEEIWAAAVDMVDYEQTTVLQNAIGDTPEKRQFWTTFSQSQGYRIRSPFPGAQKFKQFLPNGDYGNADDRMQWFRQELYPKAKQWLLDHPEGIDLQTLLSGGYGT